LKELFLQLPQRKQ